MNFIFLMFSISTAFGATPPKGVSLIKESNGNFGATNFKNDETTISNNDQPRIETVRLRKSSAKISSTSTDGSLSTNLPNYALTQKRSDFRASDQGIVVLKNKDKLKGVSSGDVIHAIVNQEIIATSTLPTTVRALALNGRLKGSYFVGEAILDKALKRVLLEFKSINLSGGGIYSVEAEGQSLEGMRGVEGEYHTSEGLYFAGEMMAATSAGVLDSTIQRNQNVLGNYVQEPSLTNSAKTGAVTALAKTADRFAERGRQAPEYTVTKPDFEIRIILKSTPMEEIE